MALPQRLEDVTPEWLTGALAAAFPGVRVTSVRPDAPIHGTATNVGLTLTYADPENPGPQRVWLKAGYEEHSAAMAPVGVYRTEAGFYRDLAPKVPLRTPRCWFADADTAGQGVVLLEDLATRGVEFGRADRPVDPDRAAAVLSALAALHAATWERREFLELPFVHDGITTDGPETAWFRAQTPEEVARWLDERVHVAVPDEVRDPARIVAAFWALAARTHDAPRCLLHSDAHIDNIWFDAGGPGFLDFQGLFFASWAWDVNYFLVKSTDPEVRRAHEHDLLRHYLAELAAHGAPAPGWDAALLAYRRHTAYAFFCAIVNPDSFKPPAINAAWMGRAAQAAADLDVFGALGV